MVSFRSNFLQTVEKRIIANLAKDGERIATESLRSVGYRADTNNLDDSFVWGVYNHGRIVEGAFGCVQAQEAVEPKKWKGKELYGHEVAMDFIRNFKPIQNGYAVVVAAIMPYGEYVERLGYRVISTGVSKLSALTTKYSFSHVRIIHHGKAQ